MGGGSNLCDGRSHTLLAAYYAKDLLVQMCLQLLHKKLNND